MGPFWEALGDIMSLYERPDGDEVVAQAPSIHRLTDIVDGTAAGHGVHDEVTLEGVIMEYILNKLAWGASWEVGPPSYPREINWQLITDYLLDHNCDSHASLR